VLDLDDFERNGLKYGYTDEIIERSEASLAELVRMIDSRAGPFSHRTDVIKDRA
jgi:protein associated with RNAse G/E